MTPFAPGECPRPDKVAYPHKRAALEAWRGHRTADQTRKGKRRRAKTLTPYRCPAGHWHLGR